jgi:gas vesicle protein
MKDNKEKYQKLLNLHDQLKEIKSIKKSMAADYRGQIKDIEGEIQDLVQELQDEKSED